MRFENVAIIGVAHVDAPVRVTSGDLEDRLEPFYRRFHMSGNLIEGLSGISARRFWSPDTTPSQAATVAAEKVLVSTGVKPSSLGALISTSVCKDFIEPSVASLVHGSLGLPPECLNIDVGNACLAFLNGMEIVGCLIERGEIEYGLVVDGESSRHAVDCTIDRMLSPEATPKTFRDNFATLTLGSGAAAMILGRLDTNPGSHRVVGRVARADTRYNRLCLGQPDGMITDSSGLLVHGLALARQTWDQASRELGWHGDCLDHYIMHQVSGVHNSKFVETFGLSERKVYRLYPEFGNIGPAGVPTALSKSLEEGRIRPGQRVGLLGIGSGLNCLLMEVVW